MAAHLLGPVLSADEPVLLVPRCVLVIGGSDPSSGGGIQRDLLTCARMGVYGTSVVTLVTVQNTSGIQRVELLAPDLVFEQIQSICSDFPLGAIKIGALGSARCIEAVVDALRPWRDVPVVLDPVFASKNGVSLLGTEALEALCSKLVPAARIVTPNTVEAAWMTDLVVDDTIAMRHAADLIGAFGVPHVLVKGGHLPVSSQLVDLLWSRGEITAFESNRVEQRSVRGTGCMLSTAIAARIACGDDIRTAVTLARQVVHEAIATAVPLGSGHLVGFHTVTRG